MTRFVFLLLSSLLGSVLMASADVRIPVANGFDFPIGKPNADGYYIARGLRLRSPQHFGEDWNGNNGGDSDYGDPVYAIADGVVTFAANVRVGWGNIVITRHAYRDTDGKIKFIDALNGHLASINVKLGQIIKRGQQVGTIGSNSGMYPAHLHFEIRHNLTIGMQRRSVPETMEHWADPSQFIKSHRQLKSEMFGVNAPTGTYEDYNGIKGL